jgi:hypothetical protein
LSKLCQLQKEVTEVDKNVEWKIIGGNIEACLNWPVKIMLSVYSESTVVVHLVFNLGY